MRFHASGGDIFSKWKPWAWLGVGTVQAGKPMTVKVESALRSVTMAGRDPLALDFLTQSRCIGAKISKS
jgi:hypothetical protein